MILPLIILWRSHSSAEPLGEVRTLCYAWIHQTRANCRSKKINRRKKKKSRACSNVEKRLLPFISILQLDLQASLSYDTCQEVSIHSLHWTGRIWNWFTFFPPTDTQIVWQSHIFEKWCQNPSPHFWCNLYSIFCCRARVQKCAYKVLEPFWLSATDFSWKTMKPSLYS